MFLKKKKKKTSETLQVELIGTHNYRIHGIIKLNYKIISQKKKKMIEKPYETIMGKGN